MGYTITIDDNKGMDASVKNLEWTREPPTKPGWYWAVYFNGIKRSVEMTEITIRDNGEPAILRWDDGPQFLNLDGYEMWLGPIPEPPLPLTKS